MFYVMFLYFPSPGYSHLFPNRGKLDDNKRMKIKGEMKIRKRKCIGGERKAEKNKKRKTGVRI